MFLSSNSKHKFCYTMANIYLSYIQQHMQLSPLHNNFISFPYFFPFYETCSINVNSLFHAAIKNLHIKANGIFFVFFILLYFTTLSEGITHTHTQEHISSLKIIANIPIAKMPLNGFKYCYLIWIILFICLHIEIIAIWQFQFRISHLFALI